MNLNMHAFIRDGQVFHELNSIYCTNQSNACTTKKTNSASWKTRNFNARVSQFEWKFKKIYQLVNFLNAISSAWIFTEKYWQFYTNCTKRSYKKFFGIMYPTTNLVFDHKESTGIKISSKFGFLTVDFNTSNFNFRNHISFKKI